MIHIHTFETQALDVMVEQQVTCALLWPLVPAGGAADVRALWERHGGSGWGTSYREADSGARRLGTERARHHALSDNLTGRSKPGGRAQVPRGAMTRRQTTSSSPHSA